MQKKKRIPFVHLLVAVGVACAAGLPATSAQALGFLSQTSATVLGRSLDFRAVVRPDEGQPLEAACVRAVVGVGERTLPAHAVSSVVTTGPGDTAVVRVVTQSRIDEPIVTVRLEIGCNSSVTRSFTVFADPPAVELNPTATALPLAQDAPAAQQVSQQASQQAAPQTALQAAPATDATLRVAQASQTPAPAGPGARAPASALAVASAAAAPAAPKAQRPRRKPRARPSATTPADPAPAARSRLRLEASPALPPASAPTVESASEAASSAATLALVDEANEAVKSALAAASASQARIAALERSVQALTAAASEQRALVEQLGLRAARAQSDSRWFWPLLLAAAVLALLSAWLWWRLRELERERRQGWLAAAQATPSAPTAGGPMPAPGPGDRPSSSQLPLLVERRLRPRNGVGAGLAPAHQPIPSEFPAPAPMPRRELPRSEQAEPQAEAELDVQRTLPLVGAPPPRAPAAPVPQAPRDVSAEELIDLEQQAEFFVVLGQDEAAIDLLVAHVRDSGGASPLPYLKLLEIYHRRGDHEAYERTRDRFNQRFNAHAPAWDIGAGAGRVLEDYPVVVSWLQRVWPRPLDAMADLESLLFRRDGGELFDLPAYRELLMLYGLARELLDGEPGSGQPVDVLLPLADGDGFMQTSPRPYFGDETRPLEVQPTAPLDLDLDEGSGRLG